MPIELHAAGGWPVGVEPPVDIVVGLVNILPPTAMRTTENLFRRLLQSGTPQSGVELRLFALDGAAGPGGKPGAQVYERLDDLWPSATGERPLDALIVTGSESPTALIEDDPKWPQLRRLCDWAAEHTVSTLWSCFSAHAAVLHMDGIRRRRLPAKCSGVFEFRKASEHFLTDGMPVRFPVPHSRHNDVAEAELRANGYQILSCDPDAGVDGFTRRHGNSQFLFSQGHPEYGPQLLLSEYCRDLRRFAAGESAIRPNAPENYFSQATADAFAALLGRPGRSAENLIPQELMRTAMHELTHHWRAPSQQLYTAWLRHIAGQKTGNLPNLAQPHAQQNNVAAA